MAATEPTFPAGAYVVNYGQRGVMGTLAGTLAWTAVTIVVFLSGRPVITDTANPRRCPRGQGLAHRAFLSQADIKEASTEDA